MGNLTVKKNSYSGVCLGIAHIVGKVRGPSGKEGTHFPVDRYALTLAQDLGLAGRVRKLSDGSVEIFIQGWAI